MSRKRQGEVISSIVPEKLQRILECPVCFEIPFSPTKIFTCVNGHVVCENCKSELTQCGICRGNLTNIRNFPNEEIISTSEFLCKWHEFGCDELIAGDEMRNHASQCIFGKINCPANGCNEYLQPLACLEHLIIHHENSILQRSFDGFRMNLVFTSIDDLDRDDTWQCKLFMWGGVQFLTTISMENGLIIFRLFTSDPFLTDDRCFVKIDFREDEKIKYTVMITAAPLHLYFKPGTDKAFIPAIIPKSIWENIIQLHEGEMKLRVTYNVVALSDTNLG